MTTTLPAARPCTFNLHNSCKDVLLSACKVIGKLTGQCVSIQS
jgi:hypothetical protein